MPTADPTGTRPAIPGPSSPVGAHTLTRAARLDFLVGRAHLIAHNTNLELARLVEDIAIELRSLHSAIDRDA